MKKVKGPFADFPPEDKRRLVLVWKKMSPIDREHFINQVAYAMAMWGMDKKGKELVALVIERMLEDDSINLADFGIYLKKLTNEGLLDVYKDKADAIKKAIVLIDSYRLKYELPLKPTKM